MVGKTLATLDGEILIIGKDVERSARSPKLWNAVLAEFESPTKMIPVNLELQSPGDLGEFLNSRRHFLGCSIAFPNKRNSAQFVNYKNSEQGINVLRKRNSQYEGFNFDGLGALFALNKILEGSSIMLKRILILGTGSTGSSFFSALRTSNSKLRDFEILFFSRSKNERTNRNFTSDIIEVQQFIKAWPTLIINATPLGSASHPESTPLSEETLNLAHHESLVLDFNYNNSGNHFQKLVVARNLPYHDGLNMNLFQAVLSFEFVLDEFLLPGREELFSIMAAVA